MSRLNSLSDSDEGFDRSFSYPDGHSKQFNDMVHGHMELPYLCFRIINTPQFQRLRDLKQLGLCYFVYPTASHNRFEHCIGTSYLAGKYAKSLQRNQPALGINEKDILCLYIAGLCHDIGHGPFSHTWENFMAQKTQGYSHENMSVRILDYIIEENGLWELFESEGLDDFDLEFIKRCIVGTPSKKSLVRRGCDKYFLYQIVANEETKIDVDKFDYILRDCKHLNVKTAFDYERVIGNSFVLPIPITTSRDNSREFSRITTSMDDDDESQSVKKIVYRKKISGDLEELFKGRFRLYQIAYEHRVNKTIKEMVLDALLAADEDFVVRGDNGKAYKLSTAHTDLSAFLKLTDKIFDLILSWSNCNEGAKGLLGSVLRRDLYKFLGCIHKRPQGKALEDLETISPQLKLIQSKFNYGSGHENPLNEAWFYVKSNPSQCFNMEFPPAQVAEKYFVVLRNPAGAKSSVLSEVDVKRVKKSLEMWSKEYAIDVEME